MTKLPTKVRNLMRQRQEMAEAIVAPGGPLDEYLRKSGADPATARVYLFGSTVTGRSHKKEDLFLREESDIDLMVFAWKPDGEKWRIEDGPNKAFHYKGVQVEVIGGRVEDSVDGNILAEHGIDPQDYTATRGVPIDSMLLRQPPEG